MLLIPNLPELIQLSPENTVCKEPGQIPLLTGLDLLADLYSSTRNLINL